MNLNDPETVRVYRCHPDPDGLVGYLVPYEFNYVTGVNKRLYPIHVFDQGRIVTCTYYEDATRQPDGTVVGTTPVVRETFVYVVDSNNFAQERTQTIEWFRNDGTIAGSKVRHKLYGARESRDEGRRRRRNVADQLSMQVLGAVISSGEAADVSSALALVLPWLDSLNTPLQKYVESGSDELDAAVAASLELWLLAEVAPGVSIKAFILSQL